jgi:hypothetical protein
LNGRIENMVSKFAFKCNLYLYAAAAANNALSDAAAAARAVKSALETLHHELVSAPARTSSGTAGASAVGLSVQVELS